ncbi:hypothetical protein [Nocardioides sp.]|uniref:hypothetical protein n=1 Tax=Nocardioides sp. TaxID=35761 RepID=UPI003512F1BE
MTIDPAGPRPLQPTSDDAGRTRAIVTRVVAAIALVIAIGEVALAVLGIIGSATSTGDDPLDGIGYFFAILVGIPGAIGLVLASLALALARRPAGPVLATAALLVLVVGPPALLYAL